MRPGYFTLFGEITYDVMSHINMLGTSYAAYFAGHFNGPSVVHVKWDGRLATFSIRAKSRRSQSKCIVVVLSTIHSAAHVLCTTTRFCCLPSRHQTALDLHEEYVRGTASIAAVDKCRVGLCFDSQALAKPRPTTCALCK